MIFKANNALLGWIGCITAGLLCFGCSDNSKYGKFSEEQMEQIGLANRYDLPEPTGSSMVIGVFSETISSDEIIGLAEKYLKPLAATNTQTTFSEKARPVIQNAIRGKITDILLYQEARKNAPENIESMLEKGVEAEVNRFVASYGNNYALAENKFREMGMGTDWNSFREYQKKRLMIMSYVSSQSGEERRFSNQQLMDYYTKHKEAYFCWDDLLEFRIINIQPERLTAEQIEEGEIAKKAAERIAKEVMEQLKQGADFAQLARQYHGDMAAGGGEVTIFHPGTNELPEPYNRLESYAVELKPQQVKGPIAIGDQMFLLKLESYQVADCKPFSEVKPLIEQQLIYEYRQEQYMEMVKNLDSRANFSQMDRFTDFCIKQAYQKWGRS